MVSIGYSECLKPPVLSYSYSFVPFFCRSWFVWPLVAKGTSRNENNNNNSNNSNNRRGSQSPNGAEVTSVKERDNLRVGDNDAAGTSGTSVVANGNLARSPSETSSFTSGSSLKDDGDAGESNCKKKNIALTKYCFSCIGQSEEADLCDVTGRDVTGGRTTAAAAVTEPLAVVPDPKDGEDGEEEEEKGAATSKKSSTWV